MKELGFDHTLIIRKSMNQAIAEACPEGLDIYFDNVGGETLDACMMHLRKGARIVVCGPISQYNDEELHQGPRLTFKLVAAQAKMEGFTFLQFLPQAREIYNQISEWLLEGKLKFKETELNGFESIPDAFSGLFKGRNMGKMVVNVQNK